MAPAAARGSNASPRQVCDFDDEPARVEAIHPPRSTSTSRSPSGRQSNANGAERPSTSTDAEPSEVSFQGTPLVAAVHSGIGRSRPRRSRHRDHRELVTGRESRFCSGVLLRRRAVTATGGGDRSGVAIALRCWALGLMLTLTGTGRDGRHQRCHVHGREPGRGHCVLHGEARVRAAVRHPLRTER